jgi:ornithine carbamoyltransferase
VPQHFVTFNDLRPTDIWAIFERAAFLKAERAAGRFRRDHLGGRSVGMFFNKNSTRTRVSFECAITELGGQAVVLNIQDSQFSRGEPLSHSARVLSRYLSGLVIRTYKESDLQTLAQWASIPVVNALTDEQHPCQVLTDIFTFVERLGGRPLESQLVAWIGDGNNMANTWLEAAETLGFRLHMACPEGYDPDPATLARATAANPGVKLFRSPAEAAAGAHAVNTDVFASMGDEKEKAQRHKALAPYQVNAALMALAAPNAVFMHCLPAHPGEEVTDEVLESPASIVFDEAENRLHVQKALLERLIPAL